MYSSSAACTVLYLYITKKRVWLFVLNGRVQISSSFFNFDQMGSLSVYIGCCVVLVWRDHKKDLFVVIFM